MSKANKAAPKTLDCPGVERAVTVQQEPGGKRRAVVLHIVGGRVVRMERGEAEPQGPAVAHAMGALEDLFDTSAGAVPWLPNSEVIG